MSANYDSKEGRYYKPYGPDITTATTAQGPSISAGEVVPPTSPDNQTHINLLDLQEIMSLRQKIEMLEQVIKNLSEALAKR